MTTKSEIQARITVIHNELETRHKYGTVKLAVDGIPIPVVELQNEMFQLILKKSRME